MREVTRYEANDGEIFLAAEKALSRDALISECEAFKSSIGVVVVGDHSIDGLDRNFSSGGGFIQHPPGTSDRIHDFLKEKGANRDTDGPVGRVMWLWHCLDSQDRQWGQPYFAIHPEKGTQTEITP